MVDVASTERRIHSAKCIVTLLLILNSEVRAIKLGISTHQLQSRWMAGLAGIRQFVERCMLTDITSSLTRWCAIGTSWWWKGWREQSSSQESGLSFSSHCNLFTVPNKYCIVARKQMDEHIKTKKKLTTKQYLLRIRQVNNRREHFPFLQAPRKYRPSDSFPAQACILELRRSLLPLLDLIKNSWTMVYDARIITAVQRQPCVVLSLSSSAPGAQGPPRQQRNPQATGDMLAVLWEVQCTMVNCKTWRSAC